MELEFLDESDIKGPKIGKKYETDIKHDKVKVEKEKMSGLVVDKSIIREDPKLEYIKKSEVKKIRKDKELEFLGKEKILVCERQRDGIINNCVLCKELSKDRFDKCPNKYSEF